ncbi:bifunctional diguanylate cyclase/phosphodiesterase [Aminivibrio sp.]|uniref:GGDEF domain-containing protein n=1 Tax=Aminivibrio sp. TaxID=1872489 RepID=UPI001A44408F|nr:bifunctional diguanylate cyclase/phosphodiesterase [Aminivibrio sp.]MBL3540326.1 EAL and GGDEF domain-containing protein [Aminivibrio sp.]
MRSFIVQEKSYGQFLRELLEKGGIHPVFQPILDVAEGKVYGYEILSRGMPPMESPLDLLAAARECGMQWEAERACRKAALEGIRRRDTGEGVRYFLNVSPWVLSDSRFRELFTPERLKPYGMSSDRIVLELTENLPVEDYGKLEESVAWFRKEGFSLALDDVGSGYSGLRTMAVCAPDFFKIDIEIVRGVAEDPYKKHVVRFLCSFAANVGAKIVAEGVENWEDMKALLELGVHFAQGYLFARPQKDPTPPPAHVMARLSAMYAELNEDDHIVGEGMRALVIKGTTAQKGQMSCEELEQLLRKNRTLDHLVVLDGDLPVGLITRQSFFLQTGGAFGYQLFQKRPLEEAAKKEFLTMPVFSPVSALAKLAMERRPDDLYDPVVVVDDRGCFLGTVTMKQIISRSTELEVERVRSCNPLSGLPGNNNIRKWIEDARKESLFTLIYCDLDRFKEYNDSHGFLKGDELINFTATILREGLDRLPEGSRLGHIGGDDFVLVCPGKVSSTALDAICAAFDRKKGLYFSREENAAGCYCATDRAGTVCSVPLVTLSLSVIEQDNLDPCAHPAVTAEKAASLKHAVKRITAAERRSAWLIDRRKAVSSGGTER